MISTGTAIGAAAGYLDFESKRVGFRSNSKLGNSTIHLESLMREAAKGGNPDIDAIMTKDCFAQSPELCTEFENDENFWQRHVP